jgi:hypothetical protein
MSTTSLLFSDDDVKSMIAELKEWPNSFWDDGEKELGVSPFLSFYFLYDTKQWIDTSLLMVDIHEEFERITNFPYKTATHPVSERPHAYGSKRIPNLREFALKTKKSESFLFNFSSEENNRSSPTNAGYFWKKRDYMNDREDQSDKCYSHIQLYYRWAWFLENKEIWRDFIHQTIDRLQPDVVYSGFAMANPLEYGSRAEISVWERALTPHFHGLDIDDPQSMSYLGDGVRPPTWAFLLSDRRIRKLEQSRESIKDQLSHPEIKIDEVKNGLWIELGDKPSLYPVEEGCPRLPAMLNKILRPIRNDHADLLGFAQWGDDPNKRFDREDSRRWLGRFDNDSDWPNSEVRRSPPASVENQTVAHHDELRAKSGESSPLTGRWQSVDTFEVVRHYEKGAPLDSLDSTYGLTVWRYLGP